MDPAVLRRTQDSLGKVIRKPPLTDKLLGKPPFRYLHDILTEVIKTTGFLRGLYTESELKSDLVKEKDAKIYFLQKAIDVVVLVTGESLAVKPARIVAGHEPERTNELLQAIGKCCLNKLSSDDAVKRVLAGQTPDIKGKLSSGSIPQDKVNRDAKDEEKKSHRKKEDRRESEIREQSGSQERKERHQIKQEENKHPEKDQERKKERNIGDTENEGLREGERNDKEKSKRRSEAEKDQNKEKSRERRSEGNRGKEREKDRIREREKGREKDREQEKGKERGKDQEKGKDRERDQEKGRDREQDQLKGRDRERDQLKGRDRERDQEKGRDRERDQLKGRDRERDQEKEHNRERDSDRGRRKVRGRDEESPKEREEENQPELERARTKGSDVSVKESKSAAEELSKSTKTARPSASKLRERRPVRPVGEGEAASDGEGDAVELTTSETGGTSDELPTPAAQRRIPRPGSARPAPPRVRRQESAETPVIERVSSGKGVTSVIVDKPKEEDDDEDFVVEEASHQIPDMPGMELEPELNLPDDEKHGGLVKKILETKKDYETQADGTSNKETLLLSDASRRKEKDIVAKEIERLRASIQTLCRSALPLGKIMDYIQEDMDTMQNELQTWRQENRHHAEVLLREQSVTNTSVEPLKAELAELEKQIKEQQDKICIVKGNILRNEDKIQKMVQSISVSSKE
ncbi:TRAF3-interacting protein 1 [Bombina bombina]|uniref:TRAF3-interacting protein 1 n=1 Tax=Bombina bombina TaxID=8345 RepID=UPI00235B3079|nr:TRAF3-interacting protein 1 [Bombina bombina]